MKALGLVWVAFLIAVGCTTAAPASRSSQYRERVVDEQTASLFPGDAEILSDAQIRAILKADPALPAVARVALVHLQHQSAARFWGYGPYWTALQPGTRQNLAGVLGKVLSRSSAVSSASSLPTFLLPEKPSVAHLREATARYRADAVLVFRSDCQAYERYKFFGASQAKAFCSVEAALLDVRTGIVPFTAQALQDFTVAKSSSDANMVETVRRAETAALESALEQVGADIGGKMEAGKREAAKESD